jgi:hypothetical protein
VKRIEWVVKNLEQRRKGKNGNGNVKAIVVTSEGGVWLLLTWVLLSRPFFLFLLLFI